MVFLLALSTNLQTTEAAEMAVELAAQKEAELKVLYVLDSSVPQAIFERLSDIGFIGEKPSQELERVVSNEYREQAEKLLSDIRVIADKKHVKCTTFLEEGDFVERTIAGISRYAVDLLIITRTRQSPLARLFAGSAVDRLVRQAPCEIKVFEA